MNAQPYSHLVGYKQWADRGLHDVIAETFDRLDTGDAANLVRVLDHIHTVDRIFQRHLQGLPNTFHAPRSQQMPDISALMENTRQVDDWYVRHVGDLAPGEYDQPLDLVFTNGTTARMTRGEIVLHVCLHGAITVAMPACCCRRTASRPTMTG